VIPDNIKREHIEQAIAYIDENGVPQNRVSRKYLLKQNDKDYPPKYVISIANTYANGEELDPNQFTGGRRTTNNFLIQRGFIIVPRGADDINTENSADDLIDPPIAQEEISLTADDLLRMRSRIINLLNQIDQVIHENEGVAGRINRLARAGNIPREVAPWFRTITEMRNVVEYEGRELTERDRNVVLSSWNAIRTWAIENGYNLSSIDGL
jgi:hypothetical protein